jgi:diguanylate cyclase (GGDEF)-like protein
LAGAELGPIRIIDPHGNIVADSETGRQRAENVADQDYFSAQQEGKGVDLFISRPFKDRLGYGADSIALSRRITDPNGDFAGVASAVLRLNHFRTLFQHIDVGPHGVITFASTNGEILVRQPSLTSGGDLGLPLTHIPMFQRMLAEKTGFFTAAYPVDGIDRMRAFRQIGGLPLMIVVALSVNDVYAEWWRRATWAIILSSIVCVGIIILAWRFQRELRRRELAERDLAALAKDLSGIAVTDPLTGLGNRRQFDSLLQREWRRAIRAKSSLSLLMIDIDHFKEFNDRFGHPHGDQVLRILAIAINRGIRRPADSGARYGGEEFAVILPETDLSGAAIVAENIRVAFKNEEAARGLGGTLPTISIGASSCRPSGDGQSALLRSADQALYSAKERGRNRVEATAMGASDH